MPMMTVNSAFTKPQQMAMAAAAKKLVDDIADPAARLDSARFFKSVSTDRLKEEFYTGQTIGPGAYVPEGALVGLQTPDAGQVHSITLDQYGSGMSASYLLVKTDKTWVQRARTMLLRSADLTREIKAILWFELSHQGQPLSLLKIDGRPVADIYAYDGKSYFNRAHGFIGSAVANPNMPASLLSPTVTNVLTMEATIDEWTDRHGIPLAPERLDYVAGSVAAKQLAAILKAEKNPDNDTNALNPVRFSTVTKNNMVGGVDDNRIHVWRAMNSSDWVRRMKPPLGGDNGWMYVFMPLGKETAREWHRPDGLVMFLQYLMIMEYCGIDPYAAFTNRPPIT